MRNRLILRAALTVAILASLSCGDVGADNPNGDAAATGGRGGSGGSAGAGGSGGSQVGRGGSAGGSPDAGSDAGVDVRIDISVDVSSDAAGDARPDLSIDVADVRADLASDGAGGAGGADAADSGTGGKSGAAGAAGAGMAGTAGTSGAGGSAGGSIDAGDAGGAAGGNDASIDAGDASLDTGMGAEVVVLNEGGRDATTTTTEMILGAASADCLACAKDAAMADPTCDLDALKCETFSDLAQRLNCLDTLACVLPAGSAVSCVVMPDVNLTKCYCGTVATADCLAGNAGTGMFDACKGYIDVGFPGQNAAFIGANISNTSFSSGRAMRIAQCMGDISAASVDARCGSCF